MSKKQGTVGVHLVFLMLLGGILLLKYGLYFASPLTGTGMNPTRVGATASHLLVWGLAYATCLRASSRILVGFLGTGSVVVGTLTM